MARARSRSRSLRLLRRALAPSGSSVAFTRCQRWTPPSSPSSNMGMSEGPEVWPQAYTPGPYPTPLAGDAQPAHRARWGRVAGAEESRGKELSPTPHGPRAPRPGRTAALLHPRSSARPRGWACPLTRCGGHPGEADGVTGTPACPLRALGPQDSLSPKGQFWARLWETAPPLCSWGMSRTVAPSGTWWEGEQWLGPFPG